MQCPNCRKVENGRWLFANGNHSSSDFDLDGWITEDIYDLSYSELPLGFQWCPFGGFTQLASLLDDIESHSNSYHETLGNSTFGDHSTASGSTHVCPYLAMHGFPQTSHSAPFSSSDSVPENPSFHRHSTGLSGQPSSELLNPHSFSPMELQNLNWQQQQQTPLSMSMVGTSDQPTSQYGLRLARTDTNNQQRPGTFVHSHPLLHGSIAARSGSNVLAGSMAPVVMGEVRAHPRGHGAHIYHQPMSSSSRWTAPISPLRRPRPRGVTVISTSNSTDTGFHGLSVSNPTGPSLQDSARHFDSFYGWGREGLAPLWIPLDGDSPWWGPFNPNQAPQSGSFLQRGAARRPPPPPPPPPYM
ncbi:hypothetical protein HPP92_025320 [Vanilla planifolia]|uniref:Uncharacterized protein n=1 Tax=Vanilla planifolia TaxID=51239 RepID=A0A835PI95_VANPL|nr:hypothetical protein HPP92_025320 [Vanilla planifolia]